MEHFQRSKAVQIDVFAQIDLGKSATSQETLYSIIAWLLTYQISHESAILRLVLPYSPFRSALPAPYRNGRPVFR